MRFTFSLRALWRFALTLFYVWPAAAGAAQITTLAGSGLPGFADGPAASASFLMPVGIATDASGSVYVADAAAQRIRRISSTGNVTTVAGSGSVDASRLWVPGGYVNGPAASARFNKPSAVAVAPDGRIVVADAGNHCLRAIRTGVVEDYAGACGNAGSADGTLTEARFQNPQALAFDSKGALYVADFGVGVRRILPDGSVKTIESVPTLSDVLATATGVAAIESPAGLEVAIATDSGLVLLNPDQPTVNERVYKTGAWLPGASSDYVAGAREFGHPFGVAAAGPDSLVYTDTVTNAIRYLDTTLTDVAIGLPIENAAFESGAFGDGAGSAARVDQPMGIVRRSDGAFIVADAGNRRVRLLSGIDFRNQTTTGELSLARSNYRIVYVGDSFVNSNQSWDQSVSGNIERGLRSNWRALGFPRAPRVFPIEVIAGIEGTRDYVKTYLASGLADMVILQLNSAQLAISLKQPVPANLVPYAPAWQPMVTSSVAAMASNLSKNGVPFVVAINPLPFEVSPAESAWMNVHANATYQSAPSAPGDYAEFGPMLSRAVTAASVPVIDAFPAFSRQELSADHPALFATRDPHFSVAGAALNARVILDYLLRARPWKR